jgi:hypothetical protein
MLAALSWNCGGEALDLGGAKPGSPGPATPASRSTVIVSGQRNLRSLVSDDLHLYWIVDEGGGSEVWRCEKQDCAATAQSFLRWGESAIVALQIRGDTMYLIVLGSILSCPTASCAAPSVVVAMMGHPAAVAFDDSNVYWAQPRDRAIFSCPLTGCEHAVAAPVLGADVWDLALEGPHLYWIAPDATKPTGVAAPHRTDVIFAPKDGSGSPTTLVIRPGHATSLVTRDGFVTWAISKASGSIERCPTTGCSGGTPELIAEQQPSPYFVTVDNGHVIWMNGKSAARHWSMGGNPIEGPTTVPRTVQIVTCELSDCANSIQVLDEASGGDTSAGPWGWMQPRGMVVDAAAIYWIGDLVEVGPQAPQAANIHASIRRLARRPGGAR